jgi:hypothetical protein
LHDLRSLWQAGYQHPETIKRATSVMMGTCQGKHCAKVVAQVLAELQGEPQDAAQGAAVPQQRRPTVRPPLFPVRMGDLVHDDNLMHGDNLVHGDSLMHDDLGGDR